LKPATTGILHSKHIRRCLLGLLFSLTFANAWAQEIPMTNTTINACAGFLLDSQGNGGTYNANENLEMTICPEAPETVLNLYWTLMQLGAGDYIEIYNGPSSLFPLIGTYTATQLLGQDITSNNGSGCLTVVFVSDATTQGNFGAEISCGPPCVRPVPVVTSDQGLSPVYICPGETVVFNGSNSQFAPGTAMASFEWDFDDGSSNTANWPQVSHTFTEPGGYKVNLYLTDDNDCNSSALTEFIVLVSTIPDFDLITEVDGLCAGGDVLLGITNIPQDSTFVLDSLNLWISEPWSDLPDANLDGDYCIPDVQGECFPSELTFTQFAQDAIIDEVSDIQGFYSNMEHSFMGDLTITFICPNGQALAVHQQGGGGTFFGIPDQADSDECPTALGIGWDYYWSPTATNGTMADESLDNTTDGSLNPGSYQSVAPWTDLLGCPLNGTWTILICDMFGLDDGNIFTWNVQFNPELYGDLLYFTPHYGPGCDSTYWTGPGIESFNTGCDWATVHLENAGSYDYTYTAINNFGCTFDTTVTVTVTEAATIVAGDDFTVDCTNPEQTLNGGFLNILPPSFANDGGTFNYTYGNEENISWTFCPDPGFEDYTLMQFEFVSGQMEAFFESFVVYDGPDNTWPILGEWDEGDASGQVYTATNATGCLTFEFESDFIISAVDGDFTPWTYTVTGVGNEPDFEWEWSPAGGLSDPNIRNPVVSGINATTTYTLTGYPVGQPGCASTDDVTVTVTSTFTMEVEELYNSCVGDTVALSAPTITGGVAPFNIFWYTEDNQILEADAPLVEVEGIDTYCAIVEDLCFARDTACALVYPYPTIPAAFDVDSVFGCEPHQSVMTSITTEFQDIASMRWYFDDGETVQSIGTASHSYEQAGMYFPWLEITDQNGCITRDTANNPIIVWPTPYAGFAADPGVAILPNTVIGFENYSNNADTYLWTFDSFGQSTAEDTTFRFPEERADTYVVKLVAVNQYGCADSTIRQVIVQEDIDIYIPNSFTPDYDGINDVWQIQGRGYQGLGYELLIFNRWGDVIFETTDPLTAWTGNVDNGQTFAPDGIYFYRIRIRDVQFDINHLYEGHIVLVR
jgi:gliding motility-associated-like protein